MKKRGKRGKETEAQTETETETGIETGTETETERQSDTDRYRQIRQTDQPAESISITKNKKIYKE